MAKFNMDLVKRYLSADGFQGLDSFMENLPQRVGKSILIAGGVAWAAAALILLYANLLSESTAKLRTELMKSEALQPRVPQIVETDAPSAELNLKIDLVKKTFKDLTITTNDGSIIVSAEDSKLYGAFLNAIYGVMGIGEGYKVTMKEMCQGAECKIKSSKPFLYASFSVKKLEVKTSESPPGG